MSIKFVEVDDAWRLADYDEEGVETGAVLARIPYEFIKRLNPRGDCYYPEPHVFCTFEGIGGTPLQKLVVYRIIKVGNSESFIPASDLESAKQLYEKWKRIHAPGRGHEKMT